VPTRTRAQTASAAADNEVGSRLRALRSARGLSLRALAERCAVTAAALSIWSLAWKYTVPPVTASPPLPMAIAPAVLLRVSVPPETVVRPS